MEGPQSPDEARSLYHGSPTAHLRALARFAESGGLHTKSQMLDGLADDMDLYEPVVRAIEEAYEEDEIDRQEVEQRIRQLEDSDEGE